ncbi:hypothetical protein [Nostoc foliaceum]|nr:hypothetical protein [Nostoc foliaceum]
MYPCLTQVRRKIENTFTRLIDEIPLIRIGIIAHGDYCDAGSTYFTKTFNICDCVQNVEPTGGKDAPEFYELVLHKSQSLSFTKIETIQVKKEINLMDQATGDLFEGGAAREMLGLPMDTKIRIKPSNLEKYVVFV